MRGHNLPAVNARLTRADRQARGRARAAQHTREEWAAWGRQGGRTSNITRWATLLQMWSAMSPREALRAAYGAGYHAGYQAQTDEKKRRRVS